MGRNRLGRLAVGIAIAAVACNGSTSAAPPPSASHTAAAASPSPSPSPAPSPSPTEVLPANDVEDPVAALEAIVAYRDHLFESPDPDKLKLIYAERCSCYEEMREALAGMKRDGESAVLIRPRRLRNVEVVDRSGPSAQVRYEADFPEGQIFDRDGELIQTVEERGFASAEIVLVREGGRWRVVALVLR